MAQSIKTIGIILRSRDAKDANRLYTIYTKDYGKVRCQAQAAKKSTSKLAGHLEPFCLTEVFIAKGKGFDRLAGAAQVECFYNLKKDYEKINLASYLCEIYDQLIKEGEADPELFELLKNNLVLMNGDSVNELMIKASVLKLLSKLGYTPDLRQRTDINKVLRFLVGADLKEIRKLRLTDEQWQEINKAIVNMLRAQLDWDLQSERFIV
ncbi:DNA repair protein RecO [Patescibacteria group bacterium]|nr:DNA repair protein RecO [Patescibacteria group bacterium]MBU1673763.1 DNA repair protein RecO [Patescibacteria group bacterium]MBU1964103.1 DNA repair protein RecO [Patescibacteria group bacterium]